MKPPVDTNVTLLLQAAACGQPQAAAQLLPVVYDELRRLADSALRNQRPGHTLQPTALVHEAYLRLVGRTDAGFDGRGHFFFAAARAMRDILIEHARRKLSLKRGGDRNRVDVSRITLAVDVPPVEMLALSEALDRLEVREPRKHQIVMLRFFAGLSADEAAEAIGVTPRTVERDWRFARAWLHDQLAEAVGEA